MPNWNGCARPTCFSTDSGTAGPLPLPSAPGRRTSRRTSSRGTATRSLAAPTSQPSLRRGGRRGTGPPPRLRRRRYDPRRLDHLVARRGVATSRKHTHRPMAHCLLPGRSAEPSATGPSRRLACNGNPPPLSRWLTVLERAAPAVAEDRAPAEIHGAIALFRAVAAAHGTQAMAADAEFALANPVGLMAMLGLYLVGVSPIATGGPSGSYSEPDRRRTAQPLAPPCLRSRLSASAAWRRWRSMTSNGAPRMPWPSGHYTSSKRHDWQTTSA